MAAAGASGRFSERFAPTGSTKPAKASLGASMEGGKRGYGMQTLCGNWSEERWDSMYRDNHPALRTDLESTWCTTTQHMNRHAAEVRSNTAVRLTEKQRLDVENGRFRCYPGHQPELDPSHDAVAKATWRTEVRSSFINPKEVPTATDDDTYIPPPGASGQDAQAHAIIHRVRSKVLRRSEGSFTGLRRSLRMMDSNGTSMLNNRELQRGLQRYGVEMSDAEIKVLMRYFDKDSTGEVSLVQFVKGVRGDMNERRRLLVLKAFKQIEANCRGIVKLEDILRLYDVAHHPDVISKKISKDDALNHFQECWDCGIEAIVSLDVFLEYYHDVSALIDTDHVFELMIRNTWHLSGGEGVCANTSCRRVIVVHTNGRQTNEEIKNDLGIGASEKEKMLQNLAAQGITDVARIEFRE